MEGGDWEQPAEGGGEGWRNEGGHNEEVVENGNWNNDDFREEVAPEGSNTYNDESVTTKQARTEWERAPAYHEGGDVEDYAYAMQSPRSYRPPKIDNGEIRFSIRPGQIHITNVGFGQTLRRMVREAWGAIRPFNRFNLRNPVGKIRFTQTGSRFCSSPDECMILCRELQKYYMDLGLPDIPYNFLIGGDGILYHGRGWAKQADRSPVFHKLKKSCVDVAYIGDFNESPIPYEMLAAGADFLKYGLKIAKIAPFFQSFTYLNDDKRR